MTPEHKRLAEPKDGNVPPWYKWGPYVSERSWGTVREDYSANGEAWLYFPFSDAAHKVYRWGEDGIAGWCDRYQVLSFAPAFWNGVDPILKERLFGLNSWEGNHGEDVKECYFHQDGTPTHSYMKYLYKYPQRPFPYIELVRENKNRRLDEEEYELLDTGIFDDNRYFDIFIEYAKASPEDTCIRIEAINRGPVEASLHILPHLWFRNQWGWGETPLPAPEITLERGQKTLCLVADDANLPSLPNLIFDYRLGHRYLYGPAGGSGLFTNNENDDSPSGYFKDGIQRHVIYREPKVNPLQTGSKACLHYLENIPPGESRVIKLRLTNQPLKHPLDDVDAIIQERKKEADQFYEAIHPKEASEEERRIQRQAFAGLLWNKQIYLFDVNIWLKGDNPSKPPPESRLFLRNIHWRHLNSMRILSVPDKWEFPWFASWDLAFHTLTLALIDMSYAKQQLWLLLFDQFQHPNGAIPAYEWEFSDLNPPIIAWAAMRLYAMEKEKTGKGDQEFLTKCFMKLLLNFVWWVNRVDSNGYNVFEGGFLGLDNITLVDRSKEIESGVRLRQSDGTGWMAMFCLNLMRMAIELAKSGLKGYEELATKFFEHFVYIAHAMKIRDNKHYELWSEKDHFFYDALSYPDGSFSKFKVRSLVGIIPLYAVDIVSEEELSMLPEFNRSFSWFALNRSQHISECVFHIGDKYLLSLVNDEQLAAVLQYVWNPEEFNSSFGMRSLSKHHEKHPVYYKQWKVGYEPGVSLSKIKGGNSNWRGPIWMPTNYLLIEALKKFAEVYGDAIRVGNPGEEKIDLSTMADKFTEKLLGLFKTSETGKRPFWGKVQQAHDSFWNDNLLFYEYYHAETGQGLGASHHAGWNTLVANLIEEKFK